MSFLKDLGISCLFLCLLCCCWSFCDLSTLIFCWKPNILLFVSLISFLFHFISFSSLSFFFLIEINNTIIYTAPIFLICNLSVFFFPSFLPFFYLSLFLCSLLKCFCLVVSFFLSIFVVVFCLFVCFCFHLGKRWIYDLVWAQDTTLDEDGVPVNHRLR